ncbi:MAG: hypothetical protein ACYTEQ_11810 [Planctomycetota bacterium]
MGQRTVRPFFKWLVGPPEKPESRLHVIGWWEVRRIPYNLIVGLPGIASLAMFFLFIHLAHELEPGEDAVEPLAIIFAPIAINILYTGGWMAELLLRIVWREESPHIGPILFKLGVSLSVIAVLLPSAMWFVIWIVRSI